MVRSSHNHNQLARSAGGTLNSYTLPPGGRGNILVRYSTGEPPNEIITTDDAFVLAPAPTRTPDDWVRSHLRDLQRHEGRWLAVSSTGIVAVGDSLLDVRTAANAAGFARTQVVVFKIPSETLKKAVTARKR